MWMRSWVFEGSVGSVGIGDFVGGSKEENGAEGGRKDVKWRCCIMVMPLIGCTGAVHWLLKLRTDG